MKEGHRRDVVRRVEFAVVGMDSNPPTRECLLQTLGSSEQINASTLGHAPPGLACEPPWRHIERWQTWVRTQPMT